MDAATQVRWITERLRNGVDVRHVFPDRYDTQNGLGYTIILMNGRKQFNIVVKAKHVSEKQECITMTIKAVTHYVNYKEVEIPADELVGKKVILTSSKEKMVNSYFDITGVITLPEEAP